MFLTGSEGNGVRLPTGICAEEAKTVTVHLVWHRKEVPALGAGGLSATPLKRGEDAMRPAQAVATARMLECPA